ILLLTVLLVGAALLLFIVYPLVRVFLLSIKPGAEFTVDIYRQVLNSWCLRHSFYNSLLLESLTATFSTSVGFIFAFALNRTDIPLKGVFGQMVQLPMISPPFMFTLSVILLLGRNGIVTKALGLGNFNIYGLNGLVLVQTISMFPIAFNTLN